MIKGKRGRRALYGLVGAVMAFTAVGGAAAKEAKPYKAPELRLVRGTEDYDLTEGITYDKEKYELMVEDTGNFDIEVPGKYIVEYSLTPLEDGAATGTDGTVSPGGGTGIFGGGTSGGGGGSGSGSSGSGTSVKESEAETGADSTGKNDSKDNASSGNTGNTDFQKPDLDNAGSSDKDNTGSSTEDKSDSDKNTGNAGNDSSNAGSSENKDSSDKDSSDKDTSDKGSSDTGSSDKDTGDNDSSDSGSSDKGSDDKDSGSSNSGSNSSDSGNSSSGNSGSDSGNSNTGGGHSGSGNDNSSSSNDSASSGTTAKAESSFFSRLAARWIGTAYAAELPLNKKESHADKEDKADQEIVIGETKTEKTSEAETSEGAKENGKADKETDASVKETGAADQENSGADQETGKEQGTDSTAETKASESGSETAADGTLEETEDVIYFDRIVRVVPAEGDVNIEYDEPILEIPADTELFGVQIHRNVPVATSSNAERATASDADPKQESEVLWGDDEGFWVDSEEENTEETDDDSDGITEEGVEYDLILKNPDILLEDAFLTDKDGKKIKKAKITVKDDSDLKTAAHVVINEKGVPYIENLYLGTYVVELASTDPETGEEIVCDREIQVIPSERILFDAPTLYIGTRNLSYDLTAGMMARDELNQEVKALYVVDETELLNAKEEAVATPSNAEAASEESPENGDDAETELCLKKGLYHVVIGAKHPLTGEEFTVDRKVEVVDGYYIYAPVLEIPAGSTDYDLTSGAEVRDASDSVEKAVEGVQISVEDISDLYRGTEAAEEDVDADDTESDDAETDDTETETPEEEETEDIAAISTYSFSAYSLASLGEAEEEETAAEKEAAASSGEAKTEKPAVKEGTYTVTLSAEDPETGEKISVVRQVRAAARTADLFKFVSHGSDSRYQSGTVDTLGGLVTIANGSWSNFQNGSTGGQTMKDGGDPDVKVTDTKTGTVFSDVDISGFVTGFTDLTENSSLSVDGNNQEFASDKGTDENRTWRESYFNFTVPSMQLGLKNFRFKNTTWNSATFTSASSSSIKMKSNAYLKLENMVSEPAESGSYGGKKQDDWKQISIKEAWNRGTSREYQMQAGGILKIVPFDSTANNLYDVKLIGTGDETSPLYNLTKPRNVEIKAESQDGLSPVAATDISGELSINTGTNGKVELYYMNGLDKQPIQQVTISGTGIIAFRNMREPIIGYTRTGNWTNYSGIKYIKDLAVTNAVTIQHPNAHVDYPMFTLVAGGKVTVGANKAKLALSGNDGAPQRFTAQSVIATSVDEGVLSPFQFEIYGLNKNDKTTAQPFLSYYNSRKQLNAVMRTGGIIGVKNEAGTEEAKFFTYEDALNYLKDTSKSGTYTLTNNVEAIFTTNDAKELKDFANGNVSLQFESGIRTDNGDTTFNAYQKTGTNGYRYRIKLECDNLELPKDINVTFANCLFELKDEKNDITIVGNGGETHFYYRNMFVDRQNQEVYPTVYAGTVDGTKTKNDAEIYVDLNESVEETQATDVYNVHKVSGVLHLMNLYNFDKLSFGNNTNQSKIWGDIIVEKELIADKTDKTPDGGGYQGVIKLSRLGGTSYRNMSEILWLKSKDSVFKAGSLDITGGAIFHAARAEYMDGAETIKKSDIRNKYLLTLTAQKPIVITTNKLYLRPFDMESVRTLDYEKNDIALYLPNVPDNMRQENIVLGYTDSNQSHEKWDWGTVFENDFLVPFTQIKEENGSVEKNYTIRYANETIVLRNDTTGILGNFYDLKSVIDDIKYQESKKTGSSYSISFDYWYHMTEADSLASKQAMTEITEPEKITWTQQISQWGNAISKSSITRELLYLKHDLHLFGKSNAFTGLNLAGKAQSGNQIGNIFANGKPVTVEPQGAQINFDGGVALYGGSKEGSVTSTDITLISDRDNTAHTLDYIYGGGKQENTVTRQKVIKVRTNGTASDAKDGTMYVKSIRDFDELQVGNSDENTGIATLCVTDVLDSKFTSDPNASDHNETVIIQNGNLKFGGPNESHVGTIKPVGNNATISIYKNENVTTPLVIDQDVTLDSENNKLKLTTTPGAERAGDLLLKFSQKSKADITKYVDVLSKYEIKTNRAVDEILFGIEKSNYIMTVTDHGTDTDPDSAITDKPVSALAEYVGSGEKDIRNAWSVPTKSTLADLYNVVYNNTEYSSTKKPTMGTVDAKAYFNRTGYGFRDENWQPKLNADGTLDTNAEASVTVKMLQNFEQYAGTLSKARPTYKNESRTNAYVWNKNSFTNFATSLSLNKYSSLTIDGQGKNFDIYGYKGLLPHMQIEFKNFKYVPRFTTSIGTTVFGDTLNTNTEDVNFTGGTMSAEDRGLLRFNNISSEPYDYWDYPHKPNPSGYNPLRVNSNLDVDLIGSDETPYTVTLMMSPDRYREMYVKAGKQGLFTAFQLNGSYKKLTIDTNKSYVNISSLGIGWDMQYFSDKLAEYKMIVGGNGAIRVQPLVRNNYDSNGQITRKDGLFGATRGPRAMARSLELTSDMVISKYAGKPSDEAADPVLVPAFQLSEIKSNGHLIYITLGVNKYDKNSYTEQVRKNLEPKDGMEFLEGYGENGSHLDPTDFRVLTEEKAAQVTGLKELGDWIDKDGSYGVALKYGPSTVLPGSTKCDKIMFVKKEGGKINAVGRQSGPLGPQNGSFASYEAAFEAISDSSDTEFTVTNQAAVEMLQSDLEALKQIQGQKHITFTSSDVNTKTPDKNKNYEIGSYGGQYHIRLRSRYFELPPNVSATFKHTIMRYNQSEEDIVFIANGGNLTFDEDVMFAEGRKAVIYGGSVPKKADYDGTDLSTSFKTEEAANITIKSGDFTAIYGGGTKAQGGGITQKILSVFNTGTNSGKVGATITVNGGTIDRIYGGGQGTDGTMNGDTVVQINAGTVGTVYGGGENAGVTGDTSVTVADTSVATVYGGGNAGKVDGNTMVTMSDISRSGTKSVYGGSIGAEVTGTSTVNIYTRNDVTDLETITADGSNAAGETAASVTGDKVINLKPVGEIGDNGRNVTIKNLCGFTSLNIGDDAADKKDLTKDPMNTVLTVTERLDTWADKGKNDERTNSTLTLYHSHLKLDVPGEILTGEKKATGGHIGNLATTGLCDISVHRNRPLVVNGRLDCGKIPNTEKYIQIRLYPLDLTTAGDVQKYINKPGEIPMTFTNYEEGTAIRVEDGTGYLPVSSQTSHYVEGDETKIQDLVFGKLGSHTALTWVEYTGDVETVTDTDADGIPSGTMDKVLHLSYKDNEHKAAGGYIIAMPKTGLTRDQQLQYTEIDGKFFGNPDKAHVPTGGVYLEFNYPAGTTSKDIDITATIPDADPKKYFYIMHMVCMEKEYTTSLLDLNAPVKKSEEKIGYDTATGEYTVDVSFEDEKIKDPDKLPYSSIGGQNTTHNDDGTLRDIQTGIKQWAWSYEDKTDSAKLHWMDVDAEKNHEERTNTGLNNITSYLTPAVQDKTMEYSFRVPKKRNVDGQEEPVQSVWLYVKDNHNNTAKMQIQLDENLIDVVVPTKVSVIAIKKRLGEARELLAPICYIENKGSNEIEARVSGFTTNPLSDDNGNVLLQLVERAKNNAYNGNELALYLEPVKNSTLAHKSELKETDVMSIQNSDRTTWAYIGRMGKNTQNARFLDFTFDAAYDVERINDTGGKFMTNIMSYHFTAVHTGDENLGNEHSLDNQEKAVEIAE